MLQLTRTVALCVGLYAAQAAAGTIYVDSRQGDDRLDGTTPDVVNDLVGPLRTLHRAVTRANTGDTIVLANHGQPYYDAVTLTGERHSGKYDTPFRIIGNGARISGARPIPVGGWTEPVPGVWKVVPVRKGHYQLIQEGAALPQVECPRDAQTLPDIPVGQWCAFRGAMYYRPADGDDPRLQELMYAGAEVGLTLLDVEDVEIREVEFVHFRLDGINAHDRCRDVLLDSVTSRENGRAGIAVGGTSRITLRQCDVSSNGGHSVLITELGEALVEDSRLDAPPTVTD